MVNNEIKLPPNLFSFFDEIDESKFKNCPPTPEISNDIMIKILVSIQTYVTVANHPLHQGLLNMYAGVAHLMNLQYKHDLTVGEFLTASKKYKDIVDEAAKNNPTLGEVLRKLANGNGSKGEQYK